SQGRTRTGTVGAGATKRKPARLRIDDAFLRGLMRACGREYRVASRELTELSARARTSAWLPALRVRGGRNTDETLRLTPTDAEPDRFQLVGGDDYRFEGQLSWDFRRLVFANEE